MTLAWAPEMIFLYAGLAGLVASGLLYVQMRRRRARQHAAQHPAEKPLTENMQVLAAELQALAARLDRQVNDRVAQLEALLAKADALLAEYRRLAKATDLPAAGKIDSAPASGTGASREADEAARLARRGEILRLGSLGLEAPQIAQQLQIDTGEAELVLRLHRPRGVKV